MDAPADRAGFALLQFSGEPSRRRAVVYVVRALQGGYRLVPRRAFFSPILPGELQRVFRIFQVFPAFKDGFFRRGELILSVRESGVYRPRVAEPDKRLADPAHRLLTVGDFFLFRV